MPEVSEPSGGWSPIRMREGTGRLAFVVTRIAWLFVVIGLLTIFLFAVPMFYARIQIVCTGPAGTCLDAQLTPEKRLPLDIYHLSTGLYAVVTTGIFTLIALIYILTGLLIAWKKSSDWYCLFTALLLITFGTNGPFSDFIEAVEYAQLPDIFTPLFPGLLAFQYLGLAAFLLTFPSGRFVPRWSWLLILLWLLQLCFFLAPADSPFQINNWPIWLLLAELNITWGSTLAVILYRYLRVFNQVQRQQTKWLLYGLIVGILLWSSTSLLNETLDAGINVPSALYRLMNDSVGAICFFLPIPIGVGIAILRYRLWDIDRLINRTLVYGLLSGILALLYYGSIVFFNQILRPILNIGSDPVIVATTLLLVAIVHPLRRRIQSLIDRRFYRRKYNATRTLAAFNIRLRSEVELERLCNNILDVVDDTMQPTSVSLWLREPTRRHPD